MYTFAKTFVSFTVKKQNNLFLFLLIMPYWKTEKHLALFLFIFLAIFFLAIWFLSEGFYGGADNINHYFISRYSFQHHEFFFDGWGRPLYTILSSPFAQFGFKGIQLFNVILAILTLWVGYLTAKKLNYSHPVLAFVMIGFTPIYYIMIFTGLTEILAGFVLILAVYLFFREKYIASAIVISFVYFARSEAMIFYPIFLVAYLFKKQYKAIPFMLVGALIFTIIGGLYFHDFLWLINKFPYPIHHKIYKEWGPLLHFINQRDYLFGIPLEIMLLLGTIVLISQLPLKKETIRKQSFYELLLILAPFAGYFVMHSVLYWKALGGSIGLIRVITAVVPLSGLICLKGYGYIDQKLKPYPRMKYRVMALVSVIIIAVTLVMYRFPQPNRGEKTMKAAASWLKTSVYADHLVFYTDLTFPFYLDVNPNDNKRSAQIFYAQNLLILPDSCIMVWDSHFGPYENEIPRDSIVKNKHFKLLRVFKPEKELTIQNGNKYEVMVFLKLPFDNSSDKLAVLGWVQQKEEGSGNESKTFINDFEHPAPALNTSKINAEIVHLGKHSFRMDEASEYGPVFTANWKFLSTKTEGKKVKVSLFIYPVINFDHESPTLVISLEDDKKSYDYQAKSFRLMNLLPNHWNRAEMETDLTPVHSLTDHLSIYIYNPGKKTFYIDDLKLEVILGAGKN
jgi:hypothetical protein